MKINLWNKDGLFDQYQFMYHQNNFRVKCNFVNIYLLNIHVNFRFKINKWLNSKRIDGIPLIEIQVRKPMKCRDDLINQF